MTTGAAQGPVNVTGWARSWIGAVNADRFLCFQPSDAAAGDGGAYMDTAMALVGEATAAASVRSAEDGVHITADVVLPVRNEVHFRVLVGGTGRQRKAWLANVADHMGRRGASGTLTRPHTMWPSEDVTLAGWEQRWPGLWVYFDNPVSDGSIEHRDPELQDIQQLIDLFVSRGHEVTVAASQAAFPQHNDTQLAATIRAVCRTGVADILSANGSKDVLNLGVYQGAKATVVHVSPSPWQERVAEARSALTALAPRLTLGFVRLTPVSIPIDPQQPPAFPQDSATSRYFRTPWLHHEYVFDAHGVQLVTDRVLARANDLSAWEVTEVAPDRFLIVAHDLAPWYQDREPDPEALSRARRNFADMIAPTSLLERVRNEAIAARQQRQQKT